MNIEEREIMLKNYIACNVIPVLTDLVKDTDFPNSVVIPADCRIAELNGHYEGDEFVTPKWYNELNNKNILIINNIDEISKEYQMKFKELLKYRQISTFQIPENIRIIVIAKNINKETINEEIYSLTAQI